MQGSCEILSQMLIQPGWTDKRRELVAGGQLVNTIFACTGDRPVYTGDITAQGTPLDRTHFKEFCDEVNDWERTPITLPCSDSQFQAAVTCLKYYTENKKLGSSVFTINLLTTFKLLE
jgi:hypothetical protein